MQPKFDAHHTWACDECWDAFNADTAQDGGVDDYIKLLNK